MTAPRPRSTAGLTLVELLAAMAIFLGLAGMVLQVMGGGLDLWAAGEKSRQAREQGSVILDRLSKELRGMSAPYVGHGEPRIKLVCDFVDRDPDGDGLFDFRSQRLLFVRNVYEEKTHPQLRKAGTRSGDGLFYEGQGAAWVPLDLDGAPLSDPLFLATEGRCEVCLVASPDWREGYEGRMVLWRALRSPIGGPSSLFKNLENRTGEFDESIPIEPVADNLLYVGFEFFDESTKELGSEAGQGGPSLTWDSTRGILRAGDSHEAFRHAAGPDSLRDPDDDVFPRAVRITIVVEAPPDESYAATTLEPISSADRRASVRLLNGGFLRELDLDPPLVKVGHEWVELGSYTGGEISIRARGQRGTIAADHPEGTKVQVGRVYSRVVRIAIARTDLNSRKASR